MAFVQLYIYRIPQKRSAEFLRVARAAREVYRRHGAPGEEFFRLHHSDRKYHEIPGLWEVLPPGPEEEIWIGLDRYRSAQHCADVAAAVDRDPEILALYEKIVDLVGGAARMVHAEFEEAA
ncbi:MAG: DUF1428 family protein [Thermoplasmata archaeon]|nr:DUF1428 family protein [Thermoplasmata archaeon]